MLIRNAKRWAPHGIRGYVVALAAFFVAFLLRYATHSILDDGIPFLMFLVGSLLVQYRYGLGPSILIAVLGGPSVASMPQDIFPHIDIPVASPHISRLVGRGVDFVRLGVPEGGRGDFC